MKIWFIVLFSIFSLAALFVYFTPTWIAFRSGRDKKWQIFFVNLFLGVTIFGWIAALLWSTAPLPVKER